VPDRLHRIELTAGFLERLDSNLILYSVLEGQAVVYLLSIRHHRQLSFDFARMWPGS
jgi:hypothetical protein